MVWYYSNVKSQVIDSLCDRGGRTSHSTVYFTKVGVSSISVPSPVSKMIPGHKGINLTSYNGCQWNLTAMQKNGVEHDHP